MQHFDQFAIIGLAALIHASFQLSVSMLTVMSGHALSKKTSHGRLLRLAGGFTLGVWLMIALLLSLLVVIWQNTFYAIPPLVWAAAAGLSIGVGLAVWLFYYRHRQQGTILWLPRPMAHYLERRARQTTYTAEAFGLGLSSVIGELIFSCAPILITSLVLIGLPVPLQIAGLVLYTTLAAFPLGIIYFLIGGGHSLAKIQRWREANKRFLQFTAGSALMILGAFLYVDTVVGTVIPSGGNL